LIRVAFFGEKHSAEGIPAGEKGGDGRGNTHLEKEGEEKFADGERGIHDASQAQINAGQIPPYCNESRADC